MNLDTFRAMQATEAEAKTTEPEVIVEDAIENTLEPEPATQKIKVGDDELTLDELTKGYLRQSDYTKKTTEVAQARKEHEEALKVYEMIQSNPELREKLKEAGGDGVVLDAVNEERKRIRDLETKIATMELDANISELKTKYPDFDETKVISEAANRGTTDLEFVYKAIRNVEPKAETVDIESLKAQLLEELKAENASLPPTLMTGKGTSKPVKQSEGPVMTTMEARIADGMGISHAEYIKHRDQN